MFVIFYIIEELKILFRAYQLIGDSYKKGASL